MLFADKIYIKPLRYGIEIAPFLDFPGVSLKFTSEGYTGTTNGT